MASRAHQRRAGAPDVLLHSAHHRHRCLRRHARRDAPARLLFATPAGDRDEIGTLGAAMLAASSGLGVAYLGPDLPARDIVESVTPAGAQVLVISLTTTPRQRRPRSGSFAPSFTISRESARLGGRAGRRASCGGPGHARTHPSRLPDLSTGTVRLGGRIA